MWWLRNARFVVLACLIACGGGEPTPLIMAIDRPADADASVGSSSSHGFRAPPREIRETAVGSRTQLSPRLARSFDETVGYVPITAPAIGDWLESHREPGQSFEAFVRSGANAPDAERGTIYLLPLGPWATNFVVGEDGAVLVPAPPLSQLLEFAELYFQMPVELLPGSSVEDLQVTSRDHFGRRQLLTTDVLRALGHRLPGDAYCLIAVTMEDLYPAESWNFVFGYASLKERVGVYSFARYDPAFHGHDRGPATHRQILRRGLKVMAHEIGHMYGIEHCIFYNCVMNGSNHLEESDSKPMHLCPVCLRKLHRAVGFDPAVRYRGLEEFYERVGFEFDAGWAKRRRMFIDGSEAAASAGSPKRKMGEFGPLIVLTREPPEPVKLR